MDFQREEFKIDSKEEVDSSGSVQILQPVNKAKKKSFIYSNQSIALNVATGIRKRERERDREREREKEGER